MIPANLLLQRYQYVPTPGRRRSISVTKNVNWTKSLEGDYQKLDIKDLF